MSAASLWVRKEMGRGWVNGPLMGDGGWQQAAASSVRTCREDGDQRSRWGKEGPDERAQEAWERVEEGISVWDNGDWAKCGCMRAATSGALPEWVPLRSPIRVETGRAATSWPEVGRWVATSAGAERGGMVMQHAPGKGGRGGRGPRGCRSCSLFLGWCSGNRGCSAVRSWRCCCGCCWVNCVPFRCQRCGDGGDGELV